MTLKNQYGADDDTIVLEFFFSARGAELQYTPIGMLRSLLSSLFRQDGNIRDVLRLAYQEKTSTFGSASQSWNWQKSELEKLFKKAVLLAAQLQKIVIFVDALDEAGEEAAREMARFFHNLNTDALESYAALKICISCRHHPVVTRLQGIEICVENHNHNDIASFVHDRFKNLGVTQENSEVYETWAPMANKIIDRARGVFQWVHLIVPIMEPYIADGQSPAKARQILEHVPEGLSDVYKYVIDKLIRSEYRSFSSRLFRWVHLAEQPLSVDDMRLAITLSDAVTLSPTADRLIDQDAVSSTHAFENQIRAWSGGLVEVTGENEKQRQMVQVVHQSVNDFFRSNGLPLSTGISDDRFETIEKSHGTLYRCCLNRLAMKDVEDLNVSVSHLISRTDKIISMGPWGVQQNANKLIKKLPLLHYAIRNVFAHAERASGQRCIHPQLEVSTLQEGINSWFRTAQKSSAVYTFRLANNGSIPLHIAAAWNLTDLVQFLLQSGACTETQGEAGFTALHFASQYGHLDVVELLFSSGANLQSQNGREQTPLVLAAGYGHVNVVEWLINHNAVVNEVMDKSKSDNALTSAALSGQSQIVRLLLAARADVNVVDENYGTALQAASFGGPGSVVQILLDAGADVNVVGGDYGTALHAALSGASQQYGEERRQRYEKTIQMLRAAGATTPEPTPEPTPEHRVEEVNDSDDSAEFEDAMEDIQYD